MFLSKAAAPSSGASGRGHTFPSRPDDCARFNNLHAGKPAGFRGPNGAMLVRFQYLGKTRRMALFKAAWILATGEYPKGPVKARDGDPLNVATRNLIPFATQSSSGAQSKHAKGGKASALIGRRAAADRAMLEALAAIPGASA